MTLEYKTTRRIDMIYLTLSDIIFLLLVWKNVASFFTYIFICNKTVKATYFIFQSVSYNTCLLQHMMHMSWSHANVRFD